MDRYAGRLTHAEKMRIEERLAYALDRVDELEMAINDYLRNIDDWSEEEQQLYDLVERDWMAD